MRPFRPLVAAAILIAGGLVVLPSVTNASDATAPTAPYDAMTLDGAGTSQSLDDSNAKFSISRPSAGTIEVEADPAANPSAAVSFWLWAEQGTSISTGTFSSVSTYADASHVGLMVTYYGGMCATYVGTVTVLEVSDTSFAATFNTNPDPSLASGCPTGVHGEVRWNSDIDYRAAPTSSDHLNFGGDATLPIATQTATYHGNGSQPITFGKAAIVGSNSPFTIAGDTCSNTTLAFGGTCSVTIRAFTDATGQFNSMLQIPDNSGSGDRRLALHLETVTGMAGTYYQLTPERVLDTRSNEGTSLGIPHGPQKAGVSHFQIIGSSGPQLPIDGVGSAVLNVTVTQPTASGFITIYPTGTVRPSTSSLNFTRGLTSANSVTVAIGTGGKIDIYVSGGTPQLIIDIDGFYAFNDGSQYQQCDGYTCGKGGQYHVVQPQRLLDTRTALNHKKLSAGYYIKVPVDYGTTVNSHIRALAVNVTAVAPNATGYLTTWAGPTTITKYVPLASTLNYTAARNVPNMAIVPVEPCSDCGSATGLPSIAIYTSATTDILVDIVGIFDDSTLAGGLRYAPLASPTRIVDSRSSKGIAGALHAGTTATVTAPTSVLGTDTVALAMNVTAVAPTASTFLSVWPAGSNRPTASTLNPARGQTVPNAAITTLGGNAFEVYNDQGTTGLLVDVVGRFFLYPGTGPTAAMPALKASRPAPTFVTK